MEDYDTFVQHRLSQLRERKEEPSRFSSVPSLIRFYGQPVLPVLLSGEQREEMRQHRDVAQRTSVQRRLKDDARMAHVLTILQSVQLRKMPTLEELLQESEIYTESSYSPYTIDGSVSQFSNCIGTNDSLFLSLPTKMKEGGVVSPPWMSTFNSAFIDTNVTPQQINQEQCLIDKHDSLQVSQSNSVNGISHQSVSSGYVTCGNLENTTSVARVKNTGRESHKFGSLEERDYIGGFFLHNTSKTITKMSCIIHPPLDEEELERNGLKLSFCNDFVDGTDVQDDSVKCDHLPAEISKSIHVDSKDHSLNKTEGLGCLSENCGNPESPQTFSTPHCLAREQHIRRGPSETKPAENNVDKAEDSEKPYRLSLQALLKKSQEYRRHQRMLRNQAKNSKIHGTAKEKERSMTEERSLSDKENDEFPYKGTVIGEGRKTKETTGLFILSGITSPKKSLVNDRMVESEFFVKRTNLGSGSTLLTGNGNTMEMTNVEDEKFKNNRQISTFPHQLPMFTETSLVDEDFYFKNCTTAMHKGVRKNNHNGPENLMKKFEEDNQEIQNGLKAGPSTMNVTVEDDVAGVTATNSQHIDQLESTLSSLKVVITDLESILTEDIGNHSKTRRITECDISFEGFKHSDELKNEQHGHLPQSDSGCLEEQRDTTKFNNVEQDQRYSNWPERQSDNFKNLAEDKGPQPNTNNTDNVLLPLQFKEIDSVNLSELRLIKALATERANGKGACKGTFKKSSGQLAGCRKKRPSAKCFPTVTQKLPNPDMFRNIPSETTFQHNVSVLSGTSNFQVMKSSETAVECHHNSTPRPTLNQSYDVDAPSCFCFLKGIEYDLGFRGHLVEEEHLTSGSELQDQGGESKVKRRLLMQGMEETLESSADTSIGGNSVVRHNTNTHRVQSQYGHGSQQDWLEQLKQTHSAEVRELQDEHRKQEEMLQALTVDYHCLQSVLFPSCVSSPHPGYALTLSTLSQPSSPLSERCRHLLLAAVKGFLTRKLLKTERVSQLVRTIKDLQQFLQAVQQQHPGREELCRKQDLLLEERVMAQLRATRYELNNIFFNLSASERMQLINWDRELARQRELRRQRGHTGKPGSKCSLSAATQKSLERMRNKMTQKRAAGKPRRALTKVGHRVAFSPEQPQETKRIQIRAIPRRVPKSTYSSRPR